MLKRSGQSRDNVQQHGLKQGPDTDTLYQSFIEQADIGFFVTNETGQIILWNQALARLTNLEAERARGRFVWDVDFGLLPPEIQTKDSLENMGETFRALLVSRQEYGKEHHYELEILNKDGTHLKLQRSIYCVSTRQGNCLFGITNHKENAFHSEATFQTSDEKFRNMVEQAQDGIVLIDAQETVLEWNAGWEQLTGIERKSAIGVNFTDLVPELLQEIEWTESDPEATLHKQILRYLALIARTGLPRVIEGRVHHNSGPLKWVQMVTYPIHTKNNISFGMITRDVTSLKQNEKRLQRYARQLETLRQSGLEISAELGLDSLVWMIAPRAIELLNGAAMALYLHNQEKDILELAISLGDHQPEMAKWTRRGEGLAGRVWETNKAVLLEDYHTGSTNDLSHSYWGKVAGVPIGWGNEFLGVVFVFSDQKFFESDLKMLELFSTHAAAAIRNARLHQQLSQLAITDSLTGIYNRRHFFEMAEKEFHQARRYKHPFSVIMFDLDLFKKVNDTYGHAQGDEVLRDVVQRCVSVMREADILGRYGGEEFVIGLPETGETEAMALAERLRQELASRPVESKSATALVTASFGVATLAADIHNLMHLLNRADVALYHAKQAGRNQTLLWKPFLDNENLLA